MGCYNVHLLLILLFQLGIEQITLKPIPRCKMRQEFHFPMDHSCISMDHYLSSPPSCSSIGSCEQATDKTKFGLHNKSCLPNFLSNLQAGTWVLCFKLLLVGIGTVTKMGSFTGMGVPSLRSKWTLTAVTGVRSHLELFPVSKWTEAMKTHTSYQRQNEIIKETYHTNIHCTH